MACIREKEEENVRLCRRIYLHIDHQTDIFAYILVSFKGLSMLRAVKHVDSSEIQAKTSILSLAQYSPANGFAPLCQIVPCQSVLKINHSATWNNRAFRTYHAILEESDETVVQIEVFCCYGHYKKLPFANFRRRMMVGLWQQVLPCRLADVAPVLVNVSGCSALSDSFSKWQWMKATTLKATVARTASASMAGMLPAVNTSSTAQVSQNDWNM